MKMRYLRWIVLAAVFVAISVGLVLNTNLGTLSSFGWQAVAAICPLGAVESMLASRTVFPRAVIVLLAVGAVVVLLGKFFCSWICPVAPIRSLKEAVSKKLKQGRKVDAKRASRPQATEPSPSTHPETGDAIEVQAIEVKEAAKTAALGGGCASCSSACASKRSKVDSRHFILGGSLLSAAILGFPVFCLLCPIGLIFGTVIVAWQFIGFDDFSLSLLIYPIILVVELLLFRRWCARLCPMGAMLSLLSIPSRFFKPVVNRKTCIRAQGGACTICKDSCDEGIDPHFAESMHECTKCGKCKDSCPTGAISFAFMPKRGDYDLAIPDSATEEKARPLSQLK